jgi:hypothetical protein
MYVLSTVHKPYTAVQSDKCNACAPVQLRLVNNVGKL